MLNTIFIFSLMLVSIGVFYYGTKNTPLRLDLKNGYVWSLLIYRELLMVFAAIILALTYGVRPFEGVILNARDEDIPKIAYLSIYAIFMFGATTSILSSYFDKIKRKKSKAISVDDYRIRRFANAAALTGILLLLAAVLFLSYRHAFITSIMTGENLLAIRLQNSYASRLPSQIAQIISISWWIVAVYGGILIYKKQKLNTLLYIAIALLLASSSGDKAPIITCLILTGASYYAIRGLKISARTLVKSAFLYAPVLYIILFTIVSLQIPELTFEKFNIYLLNRIGVGQMAGVFETFSISKFSGDFFWHMIPGASFFVDYTPYDKALMMVTEGYSYTETGVKNSLFISEAYGIGGFYLVIFSPVIVGASFTIGIFILNYFLIKFFGASVAAIYTLPIYILSSSLTGGFASFALFKGLLLEILCLVVIWIGFQFLRLSLKSPRSTI